jgi:TolA-binding protein
LSRDAEPAPEQRENVLFQQAAAFFYLKQFSNLRAACERLRAEFPQGRNTPDALFWLAEQLRGRDAARAQDIFTRLTRAENPPLLRSTALLGLADLQRREKCWPEALAFYRQTAALLPQLRAPAPTLAALRALRNEMNFGLAVAARENGDLDAAASALAQINLAPDDPFVTQFYYERGLLAAAQKKYAEAAELLMRVGLLADAPDLAGKALWAAAGDRKRERVCYAELAGELNDIFGRRYPDNEFAKRGREALQKSAAGK